MFKNRPRTVWNTKTTVLLGLMIAVTIILTRVLAIQIGGAIRISLGSVCTILTGLWFGPVAGFLAGALADVTGLMLSPSGVWLPLITLSAGLWGVVPPLLAGLIRGGRVARYLQLSLIVLLTSLICQLGLTTLALVQLYGRGILPGRAVQFAGSTPVYCILVCLLYYSPVTKMVREENGQHYAV